MRLQPVRQPLTGPLQGLLAPRRHRQQVPLPVRPRGRDLRRFCDLSRVQDQPSHVVAVPQRFVRPLEHPHGGLALESPRVDRHPAGQRQVALPVEQALAREVDGHVPRRLPGLHREAGALEVQLVGDPRRQRVRRVAHQELQRVHPGQRVRQRRQEIEKEIAAGRLAGKHPGHPDRMRIIAGVLQGLPARLQEDTLLRIQDLGLAVVDAEESGIEPIQVPAPGRPSGHADDGDGMGEIS